MAVINLCGGVHVHLVVQPGSFLENKCPVYVLITCKKLLSALKFGKLQFVNCMFEVAGRGMFAGRRPRTDATTKEIINTSGYEDYLHVVVENITASMKYAMYHYKNWNACRIIADLLRSSRLRPSAGDALRRPVLPDVRLCPQLGWR